MRRTMQTRLESWLSRQMWLWWCLETPDVNSRRRLGVKIMGRWYWSPWNNWRWVDRWLEPLW